MLLPRTTVEQRREIYEDIRGLIGFGFLAHPVSVNGARFVLRTLNDLDWRMLQFRAHGLSGRDHQTWVVATSIWMVNGVVVQGDEETLYEIHEMARTMPRIVLEDLYGVISGIMRKVTAAWQRLEAFLYEDESRDLWRKEGRFLIAKSTTGGMLSSRNPILKEWVMFNEHEDAMEQVTHEWALAKFMASPHAPKGIKKVTAQDASRDADLQRRRERVLDRTYYEVKGFITRDPEPTAPKPGKFQEFRMAETEEELEDEMQRWVAGIKDEHDIVVDGVKSRIRSEVEGRKEAEAARRVAFAQALEDEGFPITGMTPLVGEAGQAFIERMKARMPGTSKVYNDNQHNSAYEKYIKNDPSAGDLRVADNGQLVSSTPRDPRLLDLLTRPDGGAEDLQHQIESRRPVATFVDDGEE
jgi:hypothetical protein